MPCRIGFLSAPLGGAEIGFFRSVFLILMTIFRVVRSMRIPMFLAEVAMLLGANFLQDAGRRLSTRLLVSFLALVGSFLVGLCIGLFLCTYALNSLKRHKKQKDVYDGSHTFPMKFELVLPRKWAYLKNMTCHISLGKWYAHGNHTRFGTGAVEPAWQLCDVQVKLFYMLHKLMHADALGFVEHVHDIVPPCSAALLGNMVRRWKITQSLNDLCKHPLGPFLEQPCRSV
jgi:hypothetical protein